jgi:hypothetical protein
MYSPVFASRAWAVLGRHTWSTSVDKCSAIAFGGDLLEIDDEFVRVVLREGHDLGTKERENVISDD